MIIAVDFDGILCKNKFPEIGEPNYDVISLVRQLIDKGHEVILWTTRNGEELTAAIDWCGNYGLHFTAVNSAAPSNKRQYEGVYPTESRKIYADVYVDDHNLEFICPILRGVPSITVTTDALRKGVKSWKVEEN